MLRLSDEFSHGLNNHARIERLACEDEVDREILRLVFEAGSYGLLSKDLALKLEQFKVKRFQISRRLMRMNKRIAKEFGEQIAEQRGWHWALTSFAVEHGQKQKKITEFKDDLQNSSQILKLFLILLFF